VLFVQGGASTQFAALPLNFAPEGATVDYVVTGAWGAKCVGPEQQPPPPPHGV
jgi:phosphoserine aminotransferase